MRRGDRWLLAILALGFGLRLIGIQAPLIDQQAWRQTDTAAIARNYLEEGFDLLYPRVDWRGAGPGYVETNFPLYPFAVAGLYAAAGASAEWLGRLLSALLSTAAALLLAAFLRRLYPDPWIGRLAAALYLVTPMSWFFGRAFMPEATMLFLSVATLLTFDRWLDSGRVGDMVAAIGAAALCYLVKVPTLYLGFPLLFLAWSRHGPGLLRQPRLWLYAGLSVTPAVLWHLHAAGLYGETGLTFGIWGRAGYDKWAFGLLLRPDFYVTLARRLGHYGFTPVGLALVALGIWASLPAPGGAAAARRHVLPAWLGGVLAYVLLVPEGNLRLHYYQLPLVPVGAALGALPLAALVGGTGLERPGQLWRVAGRMRRRHRRGLAVVILAAVTAYSAWAVRGYYHPGNNVYEYYHSCLVAGRALDARLPADALLVVGDLDENAGALHRAQSPTMLYYCHRKGWQITPDQFSARTLDSLAWLGATHFVSAARFAMAERPFWQHLLRLGIASPATYPRRFHRHREYLAAVRAQPGPERHFAVVPLRRRAPGLPQRGATGARPGP